MEVPVPHERCKITGSFLLTFTLQFAKGNHCVTLNTHFWLVVEYSQRDFDAGVAFCRKLVVSMPTCTLGDTQSPLEPSWV